MTLLDTAVHAPALIDDAAEGVSAFVPELLIGAGAVQVADAERIVELVRARALSGGFPIPVAVAWNTVHFDWNPQRGGYDDAVIYGEELPTVNTAATAAQALPVGAVVWVVLGGDNHWAELVGKDGRPDQLDDGIASASMIGASAIADDDGNVTIREAWAFDFGIFGPADPSVANKLQRLARRGKLDKHCLYEAAVTYDSVTAANDSDAEFFTRWMVENQAVLLLAGPLNDILIENDDATLAAALATSMTSIADICDASERLVRWGDTWMPIEWIYEIEDLPGLMMHAHDLEHIATELASPGRHVDVGWVSLGQRLDDLLERRQLADPHGRGRNRDDRTIFDDYTGAPWLQSLAASGRWIADFTAAHHGTVRTNSGPRRLRVDDAWAHGSLWRSTPPGHDHPLLDEVPEGLALQLGDDPEAALRDYFGFYQDEPLPDTGEPELQPDEDTTPDAHQPADTPHVDTEAGEGDQTQDDIEASGGDKAQDDNPTDVPDDDLDTPNEPPPAQPEDITSPADTPDLEDSIVAVTVTLRAADIAHGTLPVPTAITWLHPGEAVTIRVLHEGTDPSLAAQAGTVSADNFHVTGIEWPESCFEGIRVGVSALVGGSVLSVMTTPLDEPVDVNGIEYRHQFDRSVVDPQRNERPLSMASLLISAISRHGRQTHGTRRASAHTLIGILFGENAPPLLAQIVQMALDELHERGRLKLAGTEYLWYQDLRARRPRRFVADDFAVREDITLVVRRHTVFGFLRQLNSWQTASQEAVNEYRRAHRSGNRKARSPELPAGHTWVREHLRGTEIETTVNALAIVDGGRHSIADIERDVRQSLNIQETA